MTTRVPTTGRSGFDGGERVAMGGKLTHAQQEHLARYNWAAEQVLGPKRLKGDVLDVACGTGYGTAILGRTAKSVVGLDGSEDALSAARLAAPGATLTQAILPTLPHSDATFDAVVSFETIEHIEEDAAFVAELHRVLKPGGRLLISTPNKDVTSPNGSPESPWHVREYRLGDLLALLTDAGFEGFEIFGQCPLPRTRVEVTALRLVARFPSLCQPGRWWDTLGHTDARVLPWADDAFTPKFWVIRAERA